MIDAASGDVSALARAGELERYQAALLASEQNRNDLLVIAAFAAEMRRIPTLVNEPMMGELRLQWWRDVINADDADAPRSGHALADALRATHVRCGLSKPLLLAMTEARAFDLYDDALPGEAELQGYLAKTEGAVFALGLKIVGAEAPLALADHAGRAFGLTRLLASLPWWMSKGRLPLPTTRLTAANVTREELLEGRTSTPVRHLIATLAKDITADLVAARTMAGPLTRARRIPLLPLATIQPYLRAIQANGHDPLRTITEISPLARISRIARAHWLGL